MSERVFFYCDESGAKGYADQQEAFPGETGVFAGILVPEQLHADLSEKFDAIALQFKPAQGKLHIADLPQEQKGALRQALFDEIKAEGLPCFWYAIHVAGLNDYYTQQNELLRNSRAAVEARRTSPARVKTGSVREEPPSMHVQLFAGLYAHIVAFLLERGLSNVDLEIRTDQVDSPLAKQFEEVAAELLETDPQVTKTTGYDTLAKKVVHGQMTISVQYPAEMEIPPVIRSLSIKTIDDSDGLVLAADVLANSLNYHFKSRTGNELYSPLNEPEAVSRHPLFEYLDAFNNWGAGDIIGDRLYRHPKAPALD
ncbi:hypothetical protein [Pseudomonas lini]|uniref:DUF3800 domain-containing protein n=1 Tax=Pseudomonas lini TaxID=163011 RepID=A0A423IJP3_9PSED|nr:hypothetical protein [Pseudomonas lini]RON25643.1 hypothetical protein BK663_19460 [Pseudomonas lini]